MRIRILTLCEQALVLSLSFCGLEGCVTYWNLSRCYFVEQRWLLELCQLGMLRTMICWMLLLLAMAVNWPRTQREDLAQYLSDSLFLAGSRDTPWEIVNQTSSTVGSVPYFKMFIRLYNEPSVWFCNLQILQVRVKLRLDDSYHVARGLGNSQLGEFAAKIEAIRAIVGTERLMDCSVPELVRQPTRRDFQTLQTREQCHFVQQDCVQGGIVLGIR